MRSLPSMFMPSGDLRRLSAAWLFPLFSFLSILLVLTCSGCRTEGVFRADRQNVWRGMGLSLSAVPTGLWRVEKTRDVDGRVFREKNGTRWLVVVRVPAREGAPPWLALRDMYVDFRDKQETARSVLQFHGMDVQALEYAIIVEGRTVHLAGCALRHGEFDYVIMIWDSAGGEAPDLQEILDGLAFEPVTAVGGSS